MKKARLKLPVLRHGDTKGTRPKLAVKQGSGGRKGLKTAGMVAFLTAWAFAALVASEFVAGFFVSLALQKVASTPVITAISTILADALALVLLLLVPPKLLEKWGMKSMDREEVGLKDYLTWRDIGLSVVGYVVAGVLATGLVRLIGLIPGVDFGGSREIGVTVMMGGGERILAFLSVVVVAPIAEELIFRGWLYGKLRTKLRAPVAAVIVSLAFAVAHFHFLTGVQVFALSLVLCAMREITGTIYAGVVTHMINNLLAFYVSYVLGR